MFHTISPAILKRMRYLEERDAQDRLDGTPRLQRLRQIPPETGRFLALLLAGAPDGAVLEVGTSKGRFTPLNCCRKKRPLPAKLLHSPRWRI